MSKIIFSEHGWEDYLYWQSQDKKTLKLNSAKVTMTISKSILFNSNEVPQ